MIESKRRRRGGRLVFWSRQDTRYEGGEGEEGRSSEGRRIRKKVEMVMSLTEDGRIPEKGEENPHVPR